MNLKYVIPCDTVDSPDPDRYSLARIFIVDDHALFRKQLRLLIESQSDWVVCCEAADGIEAIHKHGIVKPNLTVMDFIMPGLDGLRASRRILADNPDAAILMVTLVPCPHVADEAKRAGIKGFCSKIEGGCIIQAIETLLRGETYFSQISNLRRAVSRREPFEILSH